MKAIAETLNELNRKLTLICFLSIRKKVIDAAQSAMVDVEHLRSLYAREAKTSQAAADKRAQGKRGKAGI